MRKSLLLFLLLFALSASRAQMNPAVVTVDTVITNTAGSKSFWLRNPLSEVLTINNIRTLSSVFYFTQGQLSINPLDSTLVTVFFKTNQNITYNNFLIFENDRLNYSMVYYVIGTAKYPDTLYRFTQGLIDEPLKTALRTFTTSGYIQLGYNLARDKMFEYIDDYNNTDTIECVYIGRKIRAANRTEAQNQNFNTEHTWPQSFFNSNEPMLSDLYHLYPTDANANTARSNYPFGNAVSNITWQQGGSKLGKDYENETVFEPRDVHKGNVARSLFYFAVKYTNLGGFMSGKQETALRQWHKTDTVESRERIRNDRIASFEKVRNPFIDHPELIDRIKSTYSVIPNIPRPEISASPFSVVYDTLAANDTVSYYIALFNYGTGNLNINSVTSSIPQFIIENYPAAVPQYEMRFMKIKFKPTAINQTYSGTLTVLNSDSTITVNLLGFSNSNTGISRLSGEIPSTFSLYQNFPNPFNPVTKIRFDIPNLKGMGNITLKIFDALGREVRTLVNGRVSAGKYETEYDASALASGIYFYRLQAEGFSDTRRMVIVK